MKAHDDYVKKTKGNKGHGLGSDDSFHAAALFFTLKQVADSSERAVIDRYLTEYPPGSIAAQRCVSLCRTSKMHSDRLRRLHVSFRLFPEYELLMLKLVHKMEQAEVWSGPRPAGWLEEQGQKILVKD